MEAICFFNSALESFFSSKEKYYEENWWSFDLTDPTIFSQRKKKNQTEVPTKNYACNSEIIIWPAIVWQLSQNNDSLEMKAENKVKTSV